MKLSEFTTETGFTRHCFPLCMDRYQLRSLTLLLTLMEALLTPYRVNGHRNFASLQLFPTDSERQESDTRDQQSTIQQVPGSDGLNSAYLFKQGVPRCIEASAESLSTLKTLLRGADSFTWTMSLRQDLPSVGTIFSLTMNEDIRWLEFESSGWRNEFRITYATSSHHRDPPHPPLPPQPPRLHRPPLSHLRARTIAFPFVLTRDRWVKVGLVVTQRVHVQLYVDCSLVHEQRLDAPLAPPTDDPTHLWIGQRSRNHGYFKGAVEYVRFIPSAEGILDQCSTARQGCPSCVQYLHLEQTVKSLADQVQYLQQQLVVMTTHLMQLEVTRCRGDTDGAITDAGGSTSQTKETCDPDGEGKVWQSEDDLCHKCTCRSGVVWCERESCPQLKCNHQVRLNGQCCPACADGSSSVGLETQPVKHRKNHCILNGVRFEHGVTLNPRPCHFCKCKNGNISCRKKSRASCPLLPCPKRDWLTLPGQCCQVCKGHDFCRVGRAHCHVNATCINLDSQHVCQCNRGFIGNGYTCTDVDECAVSGGLYGNHCHGNTKCVNSIGSYACECLHGYELIDPFMCQDVDECQRDSSVICDRNAICFNLPGTYRCQCQKGYHGNGTYCTPVCDELCLIGGECIRPGVCRCRSGYTGVHCSQDIDECALGLDQCPRHSRCLNIPGTYLCQCLKGYKSSLFHAGPVTGQWEIGECRDVDECSGWGGGHQCPVGTHCVNEDGTYRCVCNDEGQCNDIHCQSGVTRYMNGEVWNMNNDSCVECKCDHGTITCRRQPCLCLRADTQCNNHLCNVNTKHQKRQQSDLEIWMEGCNVCKCMGGEVDCWPVSCPRLRCSNSILLDGECCRRCPQDAEGPCHSQEPPSVQDSSPISAIKSANVSIIIDCTMCHSVNGVVCCSFNETCSKAAAKRIALHQPPYLDPSGHVLKPVQRSMRKVGRSRRSIALSTGIHRQRGRT